MANKEQDASRPVGANDSTQHTGHANGAATSGAAAGARRGEAPSAADKMRRPVSPTSAKVKRDHASATGTSGASGSQARTAAAREGATTSNGAPHRAARTPGSAAASASAPSAAAGQAPHSRRPHKRGRGTNAGSTAARKAAAGAAPVSKAARKREAKKKLSKGAKIALVVVGCAAMLLSVTAMACSGVINQATQPKQEYELTGGVAATVNGVNITEDTITKQIMSTRESGGYKKDKDWAQYLVDNNMTPAKYRESVIRSYASQYLLTQAEKEYKVEVSDEDVEKAWKDAAKSYGSEKDFENILKQIGYTEDSYKESLKSSLMQQKLKDAVAPAKKPSDQDIITYLNENLSTYNDAKRSSHILIKVASNASEEEDAKAKQKAQEVLDKINSGELSFEDAAKKYSEDSSKDKGGDVGWDKLTTFVTEYQDALNGLAKGQMSGLVKSSYGYHIIKCTDVFHVDGQVTSIDQVPADIKKTVSNTIETQQQSSDYSKWLSDYTDKADIKINKMPSDVPYNVSLKGVKPQVSSQTDTAAQGQ